MAQANFIDRISITQFPLQGAKNQGERFNDVEKVGDYPDQIQINPIHPIIELKIRYGEVIDGITVTYKVDLLGPGRIDVSHGSSEAALRTDPNLKSATITLDANEVITAVNGRAGESSRFGVRVTQLEFVIHDSNTGATRLAGPFGSNEGGTFSVTGITALLALAGNAINTDSSIGRLNGQPGGLYGLSFVNALYRTP